MRIHQIIVAIAVCLWAGYAFAGEFGFNWLPAKNDDARGAAFNAHFAGAGGTTAGKRPPDTDPKTIPAATPRTSPPASITAPATTGNTQPESGGLTGALRRRVQQRQ